MKNVFSSHSTEFSSLDLFLTVLSLKTRRKYDQRRGTELDMRKLFYENCKRNERSSKWGKSNNGWDTSLIAVFWYVCHVLGHGTHYYDMKLSLCPWSPSSLCPSSWYISFPLSFRWYKGRERKITNPLLRNDSSCWVIEWEWRMTTEGEILITLFLLSDSVTFSGSMDLLYCLQPPS